MKLNSDSIREITNLLEKLTIQQTSDARAVEYHCEICKVSFNEEMLLKCHRSILHEDDATRINSEKVMATVQQWFNMLIGQQKR